MDLDPDIINLAKGIGGFGTPLAMNLIKPEHDRHWSPGQHTGTFRGQGFSFVAGRVALEEYFRDALMDEVKRKGAIMSEAVAGGRETVPGGGRSARARHDPRARHPDGDFHQVGVAECFQRGLLMGGCGPTGRVLKCIPPLTTPEADLTEAFDILDAAVTPGG